MGEPSSYRRWGCLAVLPQPAHHIAAFFVWDKRLVGDESACSTKI